MWKQQVKHKYVHWYKTNKYRICTVEYKEVRFWREKKEFNPKILRPRYVPPLTKLQQISVSKY